MLVDAAKHGDVEIPYFCYEPKLGNPVGACRMCLVEIEGIPKLQTSCSTPVKDGMVVHTQTDRVRHAQNAIVEFLLVNHPLDCPVCDKGGECPLQDITFGWGLGRSRFIEPKRHFEKPLALSPLIAIDRERCILCYRCVRFSQEIAEDYQLIFAERGAHTFVAHPRRPSRTSRRSAATSSSCARSGALTSQPYRFRARPWDIEGAGGICTLCPSQCNVDLHRPRREGAARARARANARGVDDGWLCDKGRFAYQAIHVDERITAAAGPRRRRAARGLVGARARGRGRARAATAGRVGALVGGQATNEEGFLLQRLMREGLDSHDIDSRAGGRCPLELARALAAPGAAGDGARPRVRPHRARARLRAARRRADPRPADPQGRAPPRRPARGRHRPPERARRQRQAGRPLRARRRGRVPGRARRRRSRGERRGRSPSSPQLLRDGGEDVVIVWGERIGADALPRLLAHRRRASASPAATAPGCSRSPPAPTAAACARPACSRTAGPGLRRRSTAPPGAARAEIAAGRRRRRASPRSTCSRPIRVRDQPDRALWERALHRAGARRRPRLGPHRGHRASTPTWSSRPSPTPRRRARSCTPTAASSGCAPRSPTPAQVRAGWSVLAELAKRAGLDPGVLTSADGVRAAGRGGAVLRRASRSRRSAAAACAGRSARRRRRCPARRLRRRPRDRAHAGSRSRRRARRTARLRLGTYRSIWAAPEVEISPALQFTDRPPAGRALARGRRSAWASRTATTVDGRRRTEPGCSATRRGPHRRPGRAPRSSPTGIATDSANALTEPMIEVHQAMIALRRRQLLRALVDPDRQGARDLRA